MEVVCRGPLRARSFVWQPRDGALSLGVVCKATFALAPGNSPIHPEPIDVFAADKHHEDDARKSLALASDLAPVKTRAEVLVTGHAHAPEGRLVPSLVVRVEVGDVDKSLAVFGESHIALDNSFSDPAPFSRMPLTWERASAGENAKNPVGVRMGRDARADAWGRVILPSLRPVGARVGSRWDVLPPIGLGPLSPDWPLRKASLGAHAAAVDPRRALERPLPADFDMAFFNVAPEDQRTDEFAGDEEIILENLLAQSPRLRTRLARIALRAHAELAGSPSVPVELRCDTLAIDTDLAIATLVFRGHVPLDRPDRAARVVVSAQLPTPRITVPVKPTAPAQLAAAQTPTPPQASAHAPVPTVVVAPEPAPAREPASAPVKETIAFGGDLPGFVLPFGKGTPPPRPTLALTPAAEDEEPEPPTPRPNVPVAPSEPTADSTLVLKGAQVAQLLESQAEPEEPEPVFPEAHRRTVALSSWMRPSSGAEALPFRSSAPVVSTPVVAEPVPLAPVALVPLHVLAPSAPEPEPPPPEAPLALPGTPAHEAPAPPPMLAPLWQKPEGETPAPDQLEAPQEPLPLERYPIERCARIAAMIACRPGDETAILEEEELSAERWQEVSAHWADAMRAEAARGKKAHLVVYDAAYTGQLEVERGPITVGDYAQLIVAAECGEAEQTLDALTLPRASLPRIRRVWLRRVVTDAKLAKEVRAAMRAASDE